MTSRIYHMGSRCNSFQTSYVAEMLQVFDAAGLADLISPGDIVAIKVHCGEWNNTSYLRPVYARALVDRVKELGGRPFVCDTTTQPYNVHAGRVTELDMLLTAERNGYTSAALGCPFIVADGWIGTADVRVDLPEGFILKEAYVAQAIAHADKMIVLSHFKGHPIGVVGGAVKNLGIGCQSKRGKFNVHMGGHPHYGFGAVMEYHPENCKGRSCESWERCENMCPWGLFHVTDDGIEWDRERCACCIAHMRITLACGVTNLPELTFRATHAAIADGALGAVKEVGAENIGYINMGIDISPACDCIPFADVPIVSNIGVFASSDPVAIDKACIDVVRNSVGAPGSVAEDRGVQNPGDKKFEGGSALIPGLNEEAQLNTGAKIGLGSLEYELVEVKPDLNAYFGFGYDARLPRQRFGRMFAKEVLLPDWGRGFKREEEVNLREVQ